jgi:hypothetical protein
LVNAAVGGSVVDSHLPTRAKARLFSASPNARVMYVSPMTKRKLVTAYLLQ